MYMFHKDNRYYNEGHDNSHHHYHYTQHISTIIINTVVIVVVDVHVVVLSRRYIYCLNEGSCVSGSRVVAVVVVSWMRW